MQRKNRLLVVDDDQDILRVLKANLDLHGFETLTADTWKKAKDVLDLRLPDLVILDIMLPDGDGREICSRLRGDYPSLPVIMLTARDSLSDKVLGFESGADDYVVKPFETLELVARVRACLKRSQPVQRKIVAADLEVDLSAYTVTRAGRPIELTPKEFELLSLLLSHPGEVLSREFIRKKLWGDAKLYSWSRAIDVHMQHLRQKIEPDPSEPEYILTVPGVGYKFRE